MQKFITDNVIETCGCRRQCKKKIYKYVVSQSEFSEHMISNVVQNQGLNLTSEEWRRNYAAFEVMAPRQSNVFNVFSVDVCGQILPKREIESPEMWFSGYQKFPALRFSNCECKFDFCK